MSLPHRLLERLRHCDPTLTTLCFTEGRPSHHLQLSELEEIVNAVRMNGNRFLKKVVIYDQRIGNEGARLLSQLRQLESLWLDYNQISNEGVKVLAKMPELQILSLSNNYMGDSGFWALMQHPMLRALYCDRNALLTSLGVSCALNNDRLLELSLQNFQIEPKLLNAIQVRIAKNRAEADLAERLQVQGLSSELSLKPLRRSMAFAA